jgi:hypothetical protein
MCLLLLSASHAARYNEAQRVYELPLSFLVLTVTYISRELAAMGQDDGIARIAHLLGVACGVAFALHLARGTPTGSHGGVPRQQWQPVAAQATRDASTASGAPLGRQAGR